MHYTLGNEAPIQSLLTIHIKLFDIFWIKLFCTILHILFHSIPLCSVRLRLVSFCFVPILFCAFSTVLYWRISVIGSFFYKTKTRYFVCFWLTTMVNRKEPHKVRHTVYGIQSYYTKFYFKWIEFNNFYFEYYLYWIVRAGAGAHSIYTRQEIWANAYNNLQ